MFYENFDLKTIVTPVNVKQLEYMLNMSHYDRNEINFLCKGFRDGFDLGYQGPRNLAQQSPNLKLRVGNATILWNKVMKEVRLKRYAGPYDLPPFEHFIQSPIGLVPKDSGLDTRLIFHLSYQRNSTKGYSINGNTPRHWCTVKYPDFNEAIRLCMAEGTGCHMSKSDMSSAFRNLGMSCHSWSFMIMKAMSPLDKKWYYFVDKCLPFGAAISCAHFQRVSNAIAHLVKFKTGRKTVNYLDDYLFAALMRLLCNMQLQAVLDICAQINFPVSIDKTYWATTTITFLHFLINTITQTVLIPVEKVEKAKKLISNMLESKRSKATVHQIQKLCGFLNFIGRCIIPGRAFTRRLYTLTANPKLKQHHHVKIDAETRCDLVIWQSFINDASIYSRPFLDYSRHLVANQLDFFTDASGKHGFGGVCSNAWMYGVWPEWLLQLKPSIEYQELYAVVAAALAWLSRFSNNRIIIFCDNQSVVHMINNTSSSCPNCMLLIRILVLHSLKYNIRVFARYVNTKLNRCADLISQGKIQLFKSEFEHELHSTEIPTEVWPISKMWH